jgi:multidrug efflux pump subunit AcrB
MYRRCIDYTFLYAADLYFIYKKTEQTKMRKCSWLLKPVAAICIALSLLIFLIAIAFNHNNISQFRDSPVYTITIKHYGVNAREMERTVAIPLEDAVYSIDNVKDVMTVSENGRTRAYIIFKNKRRSIFGNNKSSGNYEAISEAAQRVYETLPSSAQRPEIISASEARTPVWTAAVTSASGADFLSAFIEKTIKPALSALDGVAEVEISGTGINEIIIALKSDIAVTAGVNAPMIAAFLSQNDKSQNAGMIKENDTDILVTTDGRYMDLEALRNAMIPIDDSTYIRLNRIADVFEHEREPDIYSRVNGERISVISILPQPDVLWVNLSKSIQKEIIGLEKHDIKFHVLSDLGKEEADAYRSVLSASLQGALFVSIIVALLNLSGKQKSKWKTALICALSVPYTCVISATLLIVFGLQLDKILLAGLAAGTGAAVDTAIICGEKLNGVLSLGDGRLKLRELKIPLISGSSTTIVSLLPIISLPFVTDDILKIACAIGCINFVSLFMALTILPPLFMQNQFIIKNVDTLSYTSETVQYANKKLKRFSRRIKRFAARLLSRNIRLCLKHPLFVCMTAVFLSIAGIFAIILAETDMGASAPEGVVFAQIEFDGGILTKEVDKRLSKWAERIKKYNGIKNVQTSSRISQANVLIGFDSTIINGVEVARLARMEDTGGGFVYINDAAYGGRTWNIQFNGDDDAECRRIAREAASLSRLIPIVEDVVLNFKDGSNNITIKPDRKKLAELGRDEAWISVFSMIASTIRWSVHGPVAYKRISGETTSVLPKLQNEIDVRIRALGNETTSRNEIEKLSITLDSENMESQSINLTSVVNIVEGREPSAIRRDGRRRTASISVRTRVIDARRVRDLIMPLINKISLPDAYSVEFDRNAIESAEAISNSVYYFLAAVIFCYMIIAAVNESFFIPLLILAVVPPSLSIPVIYIILRGGNLNAVTVCSLIAVCGMTVNSAVIVVGALNDFLKKGINKYNSYGFSLYHDIRKIVPLIISTGLTTVISSIPFLFLREGENDIIRSLSLITVIGVASSCIYSISLIPALLIVIKKHQYRKKFRIAKHSSYLR